MFSQSQQVMLQVCAAVIVVFFLAMIGGLGAGAALVWGLVVGLALVLLIRQAILVDAGHDVTHRLTSRARDFAETKWDSAAASVKQAARPSREEDSSPAESAAAPEPTVTQTPPQETHQAEMAPTETAPAELSSSESARTETPTADAAEATFDGPLEKPTLLDGPRDGGADDLKRISGIGPKLESSLNEIGVYHFEQIASWSPEELAWIDEAVPGSFKGRASRDEWVRQAREIVAAG